MIVWFCLNRKTEANCNLVGQSGSNIMHPAHDDDRRVQTTVMTTSLLVAKVEQ
jgi:hypothetical protein